MPGALRASAASGSSLKVTLVCQASLLLETRGVRILSDPWYEGRIYGDAWELCPAPPGWPDVGRLDAIYLSHAHPDHFHVPTLRRLLPAVGADVAVLVPQLVFPVMRDALASLGYRNVVEMAPGRAFDFRGVRLFCQQYRFNDSLLVVEGDETLVNLNDCPVRGATLRDLARRFPRVDYLFAQYAVAQAYPFAYESATGDWDAGDLIERFDTYARVLKPRHMVPFASFVRFCHPDNAHMNAHRTTLDGLVARSASRLTVMYPGDAVEGDAVTRAPGSAERYREAVAQAAAAADAGPPARRELEERLPAFLAGLRRDVPGFLRRRVPRAAFVFGDAPGGVVLDLAAGTFAFADALPFATSPDTPLAYALSTRTLLEAVSSPWGWSNLQIGAKFRARVEPGWEAREYAFWAVPMLGLEGYLRLASAWFLRPRSLRVAWGRRAELSEYFRKALTGSFMSSVVRSKADYEAPRS
jgi:UDP-MurNAc hydroxylase